MNVRTATNGEPKNKILLLGTFFAVMLLLSASACRGTDDRNEIAPLLHVSRTKEAVILLHGLARTKESMQKIETMLVRHGYTVVNRTYPSREQPIEKLNAFVIPEALEICRTGRPTKIHFVSHSMGGILVRYYLSKKKIENLGRVVMLSPPNQGSEVIDKLKNLPGFTAVNGPAGFQMGTDAKSIPAGLGRVDYETGIITGNKSVNLFLSMLIPGNDDGKVSIENAKVEGMADFIVLPHSHPFIMQGDDVIRQTLYFLQNGRFFRPIEKSEKLKGR